MKSLLRIVAALAILFFGGKLIAWALLPSAKDEAKKLVAEINAKAPVPMGALATMQRAELVGKEIRLYLNLDPRAAAMLEGDQLRTGLIGDSCKNPLWVKLNKDLDATYLISVEGGGSRTVSLPRGTCKST